MAAPLIVPGGGIKAVALESAPGQGPIQPSEEVVLYGVLRKPDGRIIRVRREVTTGCGCEKKPGAITQETLDRVKMAVKTTFQHLQKNDPNIRQIRVNFTSGVVKWVDGNGKEQLRSFSDVTDAALRSGLFNLAQDIVQRATTDPNIDANRPLNRKEAFEKSGNAWAKAHTEQTPKDYLTDDFTELEAAMTTHADQNIQDLASHAPAKVKASETFRTAFITELNTQKDACDRERQRLQQLAGDNRTAILAKIRQGRELEKQIKKLQAALDTKVIRHNVTFTNNDLMPLSPEQRKARSEMAKATMHANLTKHASGWFSPRLADGMLFWKTAPDVLHIKAFENDTQDMFYHDRWEYEKRVEDRGGSLKGTSAEEFIYHTIETLGTTDDAIVEKAMSSLELPSYEPADKDLRQMVKNALIQARAHTLAEYQTDVATTTTGNLTLADKAALLFDTP